MTLPTILQSVRMHPGMHLTRVSNDLAIAYISGYDAAIAGGLLHGFREWLIVATDGGSNLPFPALLADLMGAQLDPNPSEAACLEFTFATLEKFLNERESHDGLRRIYLAHEAWLHAQDWYRPGSPRWLPNA